MATVAPFLWSGNTGGIKSPATVERERKVAEALLAPKAVAQDPWSGLSQVTGALTGSILQGRANEAEAAGQAEANAAFAGLADGNASQAEIIAALSNPWSQQNPGQSAVAQALLNRQFKQADPEYQLDMDLKRAQLAQAQNGTGGDAETYFGTPIFTRDAAGNLTANQLGNQGSFNPIELPEGQSLAPPTTTEDTGTEIITFDRFGNELFRTPKQNQAAAYQTATGTAEAKTDAENAALYDSMSSKLPGLRNVISELSDLANVATYTQTGQLIDSIMRETGQEPTEAATARTKYIAMVDNQVLPLLRDTFGAAFTVSEGESLRATLGDPNKGPVEKQAILEAFIEQKERDIAALQSLVQGAPEPGTVEDGYVFKGGDPADPNSWVKQ